METSLVLVYTLYLFDHEYKYYFEMKPTLSNKAISYKEILVLVQGVFCKRNLVFERTGTIFSNQIIIFF